MGLREWLLSWFRGRKAAPPPERPKRITARRTARLAARDAPIPLIHQTLDYFAQHLGATEFSAEHKGTKLLFLRKDMANILNARTKGTGDRVMAGVLSGGLAYGWPGGWSADRLEMVNHLKHWTYIAISAIMREFSAHAPNVAYVRSGGGGERLKAARLLEEQVARGAIPWTEYAGWLAGQGRKDLALRLQRQMHAPSWLQTPHVWGVPRRDYGHLSHRYRKSLHTIKPHEEVDPVPDDHPLQRLFARPNAWDVGPDLWAELVMYLKLTGNGYIWVVPSQYGVLTQRGQAAELWVLPSHWVWPRLRPSGFEYYELRPFIGPATIKLPPEEVIHFRYKNPIHKIDGWSPLTAGAEWIDAAESVDRSRFWQFKNGCFPVGNLKLGPQYNQPDKEQLDRIYADFFARFQGEHRTGMPIITPAGSEYVPLVISPQEMAYAQTADQLRDWTLAMFGVPKEVAGIQDAGSEIAMYGPLCQFMRNTMMPEFRYMGPVLTTNLAARWDSTLRIWWDDPTPDNPEQIRANLTLGASNGWVSINEGRGQLLHLEPLDIPDADVPLVNPGLVPLGSDQGDMGGDMGGGMGDMAGLLGGEGGGAPTGETPAEAATNFPGQAGAGKRFEAIDPPVRALIERNGHHEGNGHAGNGHAGNAVVVKAPRVNVRQALARRNAPTKTARLRPLTKCDAARVLPMPNVRRRVAGGCGAAASQSLAEYFGVGLPSKSQEEYARLLGTTEEGGTPPPAIINFLRSRGLICEEKSGMTLAEVEAHVRAGKPVLTAVQDYGDAEYRAIAEAGHYLIVIGFLPGFVICQDSSADNALADSYSDAAPGKVLIRDEDFVLSWYDHDALGGPYIHYGICVSPPPPGGKAADAPPSLPDSLLPMPDIRQDTDYTCWPMIAMSAARMFGVGPTDKEEWVRQLGTTERDSTSPLRVVEYLSSLGLEVVTRQEMTLDDLREAWRAGKVTLCPVQEYGVPRKVASYAYGHAVGVVGLALGFVFVQDPSIDNVLAGEDADQAPGVMPITEAKWMEVWHDRDAQDNQYVRFGIIVGPPEGAPGGGNRPLGDETPAPPPQDSETNPGPNPGSNTGMPLQPPGEVMSSVKPRVKRVNVREWLRKCQDGPNAGKPGPCPDTEGRGDGTHAEPEYDPAPSLKQPTPEQLTPDKGQLKEGVAEAAKRLGREAWGKLPAKVRQSAGFVFATAKRLLYLNDTPLRMGLKLATEVARERGLPPEHVERVARVVNMIDQGATLPVIGGYKQLAKAVVPALGAVTSYVPLAAIAYVGYSSVRNPLAVVRAARKLASNLREFVKAAEGHAEGRKADAEQIAAVFNSFGGLSGDDADVMLACLAAAADEGVEDALGLAAKVYGTMKQTKTRRINVRRRMGLKCQQGANAGKPGPCPKEPGQGKPKPKPGGESAGGGKPAPKKPAAKPAKPTKPAKPQKPAAPSVDDMHAAITSLKAGKATPEQLQAVGQDLMKLTVANLNDLKKKLGVKASGAKAKLAAAIAEHAAPLAEKPPMSDPGVRRLVENSRKGQAEKASAARKEETVAFGEWEKARDKTSGLRSDVESLEQMDRNGRLGNTGRANLAKLREELTGAQAEFDAVGERLQDARGRAEKAEAKVQEYDRELAESAPKGRKKPGGKA